MARAVTATAPHWQYPAEGTRTGMLDGSFVARGPDLVRAVPDTDRGEDGG